MMKTLLLIFFSLFCLPIMAQEVSNVQLKELGEDLKISFDLDGPLERYLVEIELAEDGEHFHLINKENAQRGKSSYSVKKPVYCQSCVFKVTAKNPIMGIVDEMVFVEGGQFLMGSVDGKSDKKPMHRVQLPHYYIGKYEVTQKLWQEIMGNNPSNFKGCLECPVENVSWEDVKQFLQKLSVVTGKSFRLPTEAEWEYAARGGKQSLQTQYSGSNRLNEVGWYDSNSENKSHPTGQKKANELGLYDMSGNVWEWCSDWYDENYYVYSPNINPLGADRGQLRAIRGGCLRDNSGYCRVTDRGGVPSRLWECRPGLPSGTFSQVGGNRSRLCSANLFPISLSKINYVLMKTLLFFFPSLIASHDTGSKQCAGASEEKELIISLI
jgi:formylglycine-generating enzyme required for sulfatase activity